MKDEEWREVIQPHIEIIGYDFYNLFYNSVRGVLLHYRTRVSEIEGAKLIDEWEGKWRPVGLDLIRPWLTDGQKLTSYMKLHILRSFIDAPEYDKLASLADKIGEIYENCRIRGGYTDEAFSFFESYRDKASRGMPGVYYDILMAEP